MCERYARGGITLLATTRPMWLIMAVDAGVLIGTVFYELVEDAFGTASGTGEEVI